MNKPEIIHEWEEHGTRYQVWLEGDIYTCMFWFAPAGKWSRCLLDQQPFREMHRLIKLWGLDEESMKKEELNEKAH